MRKRTLILIMVSFIIGASTGCAALVGGAAGYVAGSAAAEHEEHDGD